TPYANWAAGRTFAVGDILAFNFGTNEHDVLQVPKASFDACTSANAVGNVITTGPANVTLDAVGEHYYICTIGRHCAAGQKLAITVSSSTGGNNNNPPAGTTPQLPNSPPVESCAPNPSSADPTVVPSANSPPPTMTPAPSSSPALMAHHAFLLVVAVAAALILFVSI
ncbi:Cucumber peeling cupredoxin, partial [Linum grandiflorum]